VIRLILSELLLFACAGFAQSADKLEFEVASLKQAPPPDGRGVSVFCRGGPGSQDPGLFVCENMSLSNLVCRAYGISYYQLIATDSMAGMRPMFNLDAKVAPGATVDDLKVMLQNLLAVRFKLVVHRETRDYQKYELVVARNGPKFKEGADPPPPPPKDDDAGISRPAPPRARPTLDKDGFPALPPGQPGMSMMNGRARLFYPNMTMEMLAGQLSGQLASPVTDATGLKGKYAIGLFWVAESRSTASDSDAGPTLVQAIQEQLGLRLESKKGPAEFLIVDHVDKVPTEN
jgi:uncharacterized protein (TIGR03435 family)